MRHVDVGNDLSKVEWENVTTHALEVLTKTSNYTIESIDNMIICNKETVMTITLPPASGGGRVYYIKNIGAGTVTVDGNSSDTIDGDLTQVVFQHEGIQIADYAANKWAVI